VSTALRDGLRPTDPKGVLADESASSYPTLLAPHCQNTGPRPTWLLSKWHCDQDHRLDGRYGIRCEHYWLLFEAQGGMCALCGFPPRRWRLVVHHWHEGIDPLWGQPGEVACLLHFSCNQIIDPLARLLPRLLAILLDPPGRRLGLKVSPAKLARLEAKDRAKRAREAKRRATRATARPPNPPSTLDKLRSMTRKGA
jgi:hypothetical protein